MSNRVGQQLGNYRLLHLIGQGSFAEVYLGEHLHLGTQAAIKVLHTEFSREEKKQFYAEARMLARLIHPHIIRIHDFAVEDGIPFLVMDYAPQWLLAKTPPERHKRAACNHHLLCQTNGRSIGLHPCTKVDPPRC